MRFSTLNSLLTIAFISGLPAILAEELRDSAVPQACKIICKPLVDLSNTCDIDPEERAEEGSEENERDGEKIEGDEPIEANCICNNKSFDVQSIGSLCASCLQENDAFEDDIRKISAQCKFTSTSFAPSATELVRSVTVAASKPAFTTSVVTLSDGGKKTVFAAGAAATGTSSGPQASSTSTNAATGMRSKAALGGVMGIAMGTCAVAILSGVVF